MKNNKQITSFAKWVIKRRWFILLAAVVITMIAGSGGRFLTFNNDYHIFFNEDNPQVLAFDALQEKFTKDDNVFIVIAPESGTIFTRETLSAIEDLEKMGWQIPFSARVDALSNFQHMHSVGDDMYVENLASEAANKSDAELQRIKEIAVNEPLILNRLINKDASITAVNITVNLPKDNPKALMEVMQHSRKMVKEWEKTHPGHKTYISGNVLLNGSLSEIAMSDMGSLVPLMFLIILIMVLITTRSLSGMFTALFVLLFSIVVAMGLAGWFGIQLTGPSASAPTVIMTLAIADSIHLLVTMFQLMRSGMQKREAIVESLRINFKVLLITSVTTIIGFLTLNFAEGTPFHDLGNITATGVAAAFGFSVLLLPALMAILPARVKTKTMSADKHERPKFLDLLIEFVIRHNRKVLIFSVIALIGLSAFSFKNELNNEFVKFFAKDVKFRTDTNFISENLTGIYNIEYALGSGEADGISDPKYLKKLDEFDKWFKQQKDVMHVNSFSKIMKQVNKSMHSDNPDYYKIPDAKDEAAQYLLLYEMSLPYGLDLNNQINVDKSETRFTVTLNNTSSNEIMALTERAEQWLRDNAPEHMFSYGISTSLMFAHITKTNMISMLKSGFGALILISFILIFVFRSFKYGALSIIPNITPIAVAFGIWGLTNGQINMAVAVVMGMTLGIVVDDTVHLLAKYIRGRRELGKSPEDALRYAFSTVGHAIIVTTVVLTAGFTVLMQSSFIFNSDMAKVTAITIVAALVFDLLLLPALLLKLDKVKIQEPVEKPIEELELTSTPLSTSVEVKVRS
ncbi:MAG: MMPL family transporter [Flavobacteriaceae bacterium]|nr:MMPL family transporter [Flavobacteriaceae bacterium]